MPAKMFRDGAQKISQVEYGAVLKFVDALLPGMLYVKCGECGKFKQVIHRHVKNVPHPTDSGSILQLHVCEECK